MIKPIDFKINSIYNTSTLGEVDYDFVKQVVKATRRTAFDIGIGHMVDISINRLRKLCISENMRCGMCGAGDVKFLITVGITVHDTLCYRLDPHFKNALGSYDIMTADHIVPVSKGGTDSASNLQPMCITCNSHKNSATDSNTVKELLINKAKRQLSNLRRCISTNDGSPIIDGAPIREVFNSIVVDAEQSILTIGELTLDANNLYHAVAILRHITLKSSAINPDRLMEVPIWYKQTLIQSLSPLECLLPAKALGLISTLATTSALMW